MHDYGRRLDALRCFLRNLRPFGVHRMTFERFAVNWMKSAQADIQSELAGLHSTRANSFKSVRREVKTGGGSGDRPGTLRENRLVALAGGRFIGTLDVRRKRNVAYALDILIPLFLLIRS